MNIYKIDDCDYIAAETENEAIDFYLNEIVGKDFKIFEIKKLNENQLNNYIFYFEENQRNDNILQMPFKQYLQELVDKKVKFPLFFASTEY